MLPALFGVSVSQINLLLDTFIASFLMTGSISWLYYSDRLLEFPLGMFGIAIATVILPALSRKHVEQSGNQFAETMDWGGTNGASPWYSSHAWYDCASKTYVDGAVHAW